MLQLNYMDSGHHKNEDKYISSPVHFEKVDEISIKKLKVALLNL